MPRLSIDISPEQHQKLKAIAALKGQSIKEYVLNRGSRRCSFPRRPLTKTKLFEFWLISFGIGSRKRDAVSFQPSPLMSYGKRSANGRDCSLSHARLLPHA